jgi:RNA polymerase sigma-70 factor, ECF subfamily
MNAFRTRALRTREGPQEPMTETLVDENVEDQRLVVAAQQGDLDAYNQLVTRHERAVYSVCLRMLRDASLAEDATQDAFIRAWNSIDSFRGGIVRPWLLRIATNRTYDILRAQARRPAQSLEAQPFESEADWTSQTDAVEHPESFATRGELSSFLESALAELPEDQRLAIVLSDVQGYAYEEIATIMDVAVGTVKSRISRGRSRLRTVLQASERGRELTERFGRLNDT